MPRAVLIAIGGNALFDTQNGNNIDPTSLDLVCQQIVKVVAAGYQPIITFGNGPQVGNLLEMAENFIAPPRWPIPLDVCVSWTQGEIGYYLSKTLTHQLAQAGLSRPIIAVNTTVMVDLDDPAFLNPTKYVGNFYTQEQAKTLVDAQGWQMKQDSNRGYRRVVASPLPKGVLEMESIRALKDTGAIVLCGGGGGIPVTMEEGVLRGVEAVIDKDFTACLLASGLGIPDLLICTGVDNVYLHYGEPEQQALERVSVSEALQLSLIHI